MSGTQFAATPSTTTGGQRVFIGVAILIFAAASAYLALVIMTRVDSLFFPGRQLTLPSAVQEVPLPGVDSKGESGNQDRINILVLGVDRRPQEGQSASRTDTMFVVTIDPKTHSTGILGIPRDLMVDIPYSEGTGTFEDRVNAVYQIGEEEGYSGGGIGLLKRVLAGEPFGITIDKHVIVDFEGFEEIIDALGGIDVDVPDEVFDPYYSKSEELGDFDPQHFEPGVQHMDGSTALAYARIRFSSDDLDRIQRQQRVIFATIDKAKSLNVLSNAGDLWAKYKDAIETDISDILIPGYADLANQVQDDIHAISLGPATVPYTTERGAQVLIGDDEAIGEIVDSLFVEQPGSAPQAEATPDPVVVHVQNGAGVDGLAGRVVAFIASKGYPPGDLDSADAFDGLSHDATEIIDVDGTHERNGFLLAKYLGLDPERVRVATTAEKALLDGSPAAIVVVLGADFDLDSLIQSPTTTTPDG